MTKKNKVINFILNALFILFGFALSVVIFVLLVLCLKTNKTTMEISDFMGYKPVICISNSMEPEFKAGDITISQKVLEDEINVGDVVTFRNNGEIITHRVIDVLNENGTKRFVTKGDSNNISDEKEITYLQMEGKVVYVIPAIGRIIIMLKSPLGFLIVFFIPISIIAIYFKIRLDRKNIKELRKRKLLKRLQYKTLGENIK